MRRTGLVTIAIALAGCGGGTSSGSTPSGGETAGGEAAAECSVPNSPAADVYAQAGHAVAAGDLATAATLYEQACEQGNPCGCTERGEAQVASAPATDTEAALAGIAFLERGCAGGDNWGCHQAAVAIWDWAPERAARARELFAQACENGEADSCTELARFMVTGTTEPPSAAEALELYDRACENGSRYACYLLGDAHAEGVGTPMDPERARELLTWACDEAEIAPACTAWADLLEESDESRAAILGRGCDRGDPFACDELDEDSPRRGGDAPLATIAATRPAAQALSDGEWTGTSAIGGDVLVSGLGLRTSCVGYIGAQPTAVLTVPENVLSSTIRVHAPADSILVVRDASGRWSCNDDGPGGSYDAHVELEDPAPGEVLVWAGTLRPGEVQNAQLVVSTDVSSPTVTLDSLTAPRPETQAMPTRAMAHYRLQVATVPGVAGVVRVDGQDVWSFTSEGGAVTSERVQCLPRPGRHTREVAVLQRRGRARPVGERGLVHVELHGLEQPGDPSEASRAFQIDWSPDAPARRVWQLTVGRRQGAAASDACTQAAAAPAAAAPAPAAAAPAPAPAAAQ